MAPNTRVGRAGLGAVVLGVLGGAIAPNAMAAESHGSQPVKRAHVLAAKVANQAGSAEVKSATQGSWQGSPVSVTAKKAEAPKPAAPAAPAAQAQNQARAAQAQAPAGRAAGAAAATQAAQAQAAQAPAAPQAAAAQAPAAAQSAVPASAKGAAIAAYAKQFVGAPYVWAGTSPSGWDCVGFTHYVYTHFGIPAPRSHSLAAYAGFQRVSEADAQPGDIMVWPGQHTSIYLGGGMNISALSPKLGTQIMSNAQLGGGAVFYRLIK